MQGSVVIVIPHDKEVCILYNPEKKEYCIICLDFTFNVTFCFQCYHRDYGSYLKFNGQNLGYLSPIILEAGFGALRRISEANFGAKPPTT